METGNGVGNRENSIHLFHASNTNVEETRTFLISSIARLMAFASDPILTTNIAVVTLFIASAVASCSCQRYAVLRCMTCEN